MLAVLNIDHEISNQTQTVLVDPDGVKQKIRVELQYMEHTGRWMMSLFRSDGSCIASYIPLVASDLVINDLVGIYGYKAIGSIFCWTNNPELQGSDPAEDALREFDVVWGDRLE